MLSPLYKTLTPKAYENKAPGCRVRLKVLPHVWTFVIMHIAICIVQVGLLKPKPKPPGMSLDDEQLHILPLYVMDTTDEFESADVLENFRRFPCKVRVRATALLPCRQHGKKHKEKCN